MEKKTPGFTLDDLIPSEETASGMHTPVGENMFAIPNKADDDEVEEESIEKEALGLTSMPQSLYGGEVLDLPGAPQPSGLSREQGEDEETEFFGAKEEGVDLPPEHYKTQKTQEMSESDEPDEEFFDFLFNKNQKKSGTSLSIGAIMKTHLKNLEDGLKKISAVKSDFSLGNKLATDALNRDFRAAWGNVIQTLGALQSHAGISPPEKAAQYQKLTRDRVLGPEGKEQEPIDNLGTLNQDLTQVFSTVYGYRWGEKQWNDMGYKGMIRKVVEAATVFNEMYAQIKSTEEFGTSEQETEYPESMQPEDDRSPMAKREESPGVAPAEKASSGWEGYLSRSPAGAQVKAAWEAWLSGNPGNGYDLSFGSWVQWYNSVRGGRHLDPAEVMEMLKVDPAAAAPEAAAEAEGKTPEETAADAAATPEEAPEAPPISDASKPPREALEEYFRAIASKTREARIAGPLRLKNARVRRRIRMLGGPAAAVEAVLSFRGGGDAEKGLALYTEYDQTQEATGTEERAGKVVSSYKMSEFQTKAISDILTLKPRDYAEREGSRRSDAFENRNDQLLKIASTIS